MLALALALVSVAGTAALSISPQLTLFSGAPVTFQVGIAVVFDVSGSTTTADDGTVLGIDGLFFLLDFGELNSAGRPSFAQLNGNDSVQWVTHFYRTSGTKRIRVTTSDRPFTAPTDRRQLPVSVMSNGLPPPVIARRVRVSPSKECFQFTVDSLVDGTSAIQRVRVAGAEFHRQRLDSKSMSKLFARLGEQPAVRVTNQTHQLNLVSQWDPVNSWWQASYNKTFLTGSKITMMSMVSSKHVGYLGCSVKDTWSDSSLGLFGSLNLGRDISQVELPDEWKQNFQPVSAHLAQDQCSPKHAILSFRFKTDAGHTGMTMVFTDSLFGAGTRWLDVAADSAMTSALSSNVKPLGVAIMRPSILFLTEGGLYAVRDFVSTASGPKLERLTITLKGEIMVPDNTSALFTSTNCLLADTNRFVYVVVSRRTHRDSVLQSGGKGVLTEWTVGFDTSQDFSGLSVVSVLRDSAVDESVYLLGQTVPGCCQLVGECCYTGALVVRQKVTGATKVTTRLPIDDLVVAMVAHSQTDEIYVYGRSLWYSVSGVGFRKLVTLGTENEYFTQFKSSAASSELLLFTNFNNAYFGRAGALNLAPIAVSTHAGSTVTTIAAGTGSNSFYLVDVPIVSTSANNTVSVAIYQKPMGKLASADATDYFSITSIKKRPILVRAFLPESQLSLPDVNLAPFFLDQHTLRFYAMFPNGTFARSKLSTNLESAIISQKTYRSAQIFQVDNDGSYFDAYTATRLTSALSSTNGVVASLFLTCSLWSQTRARLQSGQQIIVSSLFDNSISTVWTREHIGTSITFRHPATLFGTIYVVECLNSTTVTGILVGVGDSLVPALDEQRNRTGLLLSVWDLVNFGSQKPSRLGAVHLQSQLAVLNSTSTAGLLMASATPGGFSSNDQGSIVVFGLDGYGVVQNVISPTQILINTVNSVPQGVYSAGEWELYTADEDDTFPLYFRVGSAPVKSREWRLSLPPCSVQTLSDNVNSSIWFLSDEENLLWNISSTAAPDTAISTTAQSNFIVTVSNPQSLQVNVSSPAELSTLRLDIASTKSVGYSNIVIRPQVVPLDCDQDFPSATVCNMCPPFVSYGQHVDGADVVQLLAGDWDKFKTRTDEDLFQTLPVNYRPPSALGYAVPTSKYIYNSDPSASRYNDWFGISKSTGAYSQCMGKLSQDECGCTSSHRVSSSPEDTDCIQRVVKVYFRENFTPSIGKFVRNEFVGAITAPFTIHEINNRTDWCFDNDDTCGSVLSDNNGAVFDPTQNVTINWMGTELFHFALAVESGQCPIRVYLKVYVVHPTLLPSDSDLCMAWTGFAFFLFLLGVYLSSFNSE